MDRAKVGCVVAFLSFMPTARVWATAWEESDGASWDYLETLEAYRTKDDDKLSDLLTKMPLTEVHALFLQQLNQDLQHSYRCQTLLIDRVKSSKDDYLATLKEVVKTPGTFADLLDRLFYEGGSLLEAKSFFEVLRSARDAGRNDNVEKLKKVLVSASQEHPKELHRAVSLALGDHDNDLVIKLWNANADQRSDELFRKILDGAVAHEDRSLAASFIEAFSEYELSYVISEASKRYATGVALAEKVSQDLWMAYPRETDDKETDDKEAETTSPKEWQEEVRAALCAFLRDPNNPYYRQDHMRLLARHLETWIGKREGMTTTASDIKAECEQWAARHKKYGIPLVMRTRIY